MKQLLIVGETILAVGPFVDDGENIRAYTPEGKADAIYPKHVMPGWALATCLLPDDFTPAGYTYDWPTFSVVKKQSPAPTQADKDEKLSAVNAECDKRMSSLVAGYPENEQKTFAKQEDEARAYMANPAGATPMIDALAATRGIDKGVLVSRIITKADLFAQYSGAVIGYRQKLEDQINAAQTVEALDAIDIASGWPV